MLHPGFDYSMRRVLSCLRALLIQSVQRLPRSCLRGIRSGKTIHLSLSKWYFNCSTVWVTWLVKMRTMLRTININVVSLSMVTKFVSAVITTLWLLINTYDMQVAARLLQTFNNRVVAVTDGGKGKDDVMHAAEGSGLNGLCVCECMYVCVYVYVCVCVCVCVCLYVCDGLCVHVYSSSSCPNTGPVHWECLWVS